MLTLRGMTAALALALAACSGAAPPPPAPPAPHDPWPEFAASFIDSYFKANPFFAVQAGRHEFDGQMPDLSAAGIAHEVARLQRLRTEAQSFDLVTMTTGERFEREYLLTAIDSDLFWLDRARFPFAQPRLVHRPARSRRLPQPRLRTARARACTATSATRARFRRSPPTSAPTCRRRCRRPSCSAASMPSAALRASIARTCRQGVRDRCRTPPPSSELAAANAAAAPGDGRAEVVARGRALAQRRPRLRPRRAAVPARCCAPPSASTCRSRSCSPIGRADLERNTAGAARTPRAPATCRTARCRRVSRRCAPTSPAAAWSRARGRSSRGLRAFVVAHGIVTIPSEEQAAGRGSTALQPRQLRLHQHPRSLRQGGGLRLQHRAAGPEMERAGARRLHPRQGNLLYTSVHEVWPGHFLQFLHSNRNPSQVAALWVGYAYAEGWAHYAEEMMWDEGLGDGDPRAARRAAASMRCCATCVSSRPSACTPRA